MSPKSFNVPQGKTFFELEGITKNLIRKFPVGPVIKCFAIPPNSKIEQTAKKEFA